MQIRARGIHTFGYHGPNPLVFTPRRGIIQPLTRNLAPWLTNLHSQVPISSWVERSNAAWSALLRGTTSGRTGRVLNSGLDLDPNPESCTLPLDQLATLLALCAANSPVSEFPSQRPATRSFNFFFDLRLNKRLGKQSWGWWFETPSCSSWRHCSNELYSLSSQH